MEFLWAQVAGNDAIPLPEEETSIQGFYAEKTVLITGGTGAVGKLLVAKLLAFCPRITKIYLTIRAKNCSQMGLRQENLFDHPAFEDIRRSNSEVLEKVELIRGEFTLPNLGLIPSDVEKLVAETEVVFHLASSTLFDEKFKLSVELNVQATRDLLEIAKRMRKLKVFLHASSLFAHCDKETIEEIYERPFISAKALIEFLESMDPHVHYTKPINLGNLPNNYVFTKAIAEELIKNEHRTLPVVIVRLPLLISSYRYPSRGFTDTVNSLIGLSMTMYIGLNKSILAKKDLVAEVFPIDMAANAMITVAWDTAQTRALNDNVEVPLEDHLQIYNLTTSRCNRLPWKLFFSLSMKYGYRYPTIYTLAFPWCILHTHKRWHFVLVTLLHYIPGYLIDFWTLYLFYKTNFIGYYIKIDMLSKTLTYFTTRSWTVRTQNTQKLLQRMDEDDREMFDFDAARIDWESYFQHYILGIRKHILKDDDRTLSLARKRNLRRLILLIGKMCLVGVLCLVYIWFR